MMHMITDNITAYRYAIADRAKAEAIFKLNPLTQNMEELQSCREEEQLRLDGLMSIIVMTVKEAAAEPPHNPFSINGDVNQPDQTAPSTKPPIRNGPPPREEGDQCE